MAHLVYFTFRAYICIICNCICISRRIDTRLIDTNVFYDHNNDKKGPEEVYISASHCDKGEHTCPKAVTTTSTRLCNVALLAATYILPSQE